MTTIPRNARADERGFVLIMVLVTLLLLTVLGIWASRTTQMELRTAANERKHQSAFYQADAGTYLAERVIQHNRVCAALRGRKGNDKCFFDNDRLSYSLHLPNPCFTDTTQSTQPYSAIVVESVKDIKQDADDDHYTFRYYPEYGAAGRAAANTRGPRTNVLVYQLKSKGSEGDCRDFGECNPIKTSVYLIRAQHVGVKPGGDDDAESRVSILWQVSGVDINGPIQDDDCEFFH